MTAASISFYASAVLALLAALVAVLARRRERALAGAALAFAALLVPLIQLGAAAVAALMLVFAATLVIVLGLLARIDAAGSEPRLSIAYWLPAGLGLLGFAWVLLATGSRQVVDLGSPLKPGSRFGDSSALLIELGNQFVVPALLVALLSLVAVVAAVIGLVGVGGGRGPAHCGAPYGSR